MQRFYTVFIVSKKPIDLSSFQENDSAVQHFIEEDFHLESDRKGGWLIQSNVPKYAKPGYPFFVKVTGSTVSNVIVNWLKEVVASFSYEPVYKKPKK